jgi:hypothetical protein
MVIQSAVEAYIDIRPGHHYRASVRVTHASCQESRQQHHRQTDAEAFKTFVLLDHADLPFMEEPKQYGRPSNTTNRSLIAQRNILAARADPQI